MRQVFDLDQEFLIKKGGVAHQTLKQYISEAIHNNVFGRNYIINSMPGLGKSHATTELLSTLSTPPVIFQGASSISAYAIEYATAKYLSLKQKTPLVVVNDDCDILFEDKSVNITKKMFDDAAVLKYGKNIRALRHLCTDLQYEALEYFQSLNPESPGFSVPTSNTTFIILTNRRLPTINEAEDARKKEVARSLHAIRRRVEYKTIDMSNLELWGYVAWITLNEKITEKIMPGITPELKHDILWWAYANWDTVTERNLSLIEKMTREIVRYPGSYKDIWKSSYIDRGE
jgi:hypothetical protein